MSWLKPFSSPAIVGVALRFLAILLCASPLAAQSNDNNFLFVLASGFLCDPSAASACPATAKSSNGHPPAIHGDSHKVLFSRSLSSCQRLIRGAGQRHFG
jgi:hypothetical protein